MIDDDAEEIEWAKQDADDVLQLAVLHFLTMKEGQSATFKLIGMQLALLRQAARLAVILKTKTGAQYTKAKFGWFARSEYADVVRYQAKQQAKPKGPHLKVVK